MKTAERKQKLIKVLIAVGINVGLMLLFLLLFEPTGKSDDYDMMNVLYGGYNGEYSPFILYSNPIYGYFLCFLLKLIPSAPWYFIVQYAFMLWGMIEITIIFLNKPKIPVWLLIPILSFVYYECFIRITFSKTSGLLIACGFLIIFYLLDTLKRPSVRMLEGIALILIGNLMRLELFRMILEIFAGGFIIFLIMNIKPFNRRILISIISFVVIAGGLYMFTNTSSKISVSMYNSDQIWADYLSTNRSRSNLLDYGIPDYYTYQEEYEEIGVSYEDYQMWLDNQDGDTDRLSAEIYKQIRSIANHDVQKSFLDQFKAAFDGLITWCFSNTMFYFFIVSGLLFFLTTPQKWYYIFLVLTFCLVPYFYLSIAGRTQHHVDAIIFITGAFLLLYFCDSQIKLRKVETVLIVGLMGISFICAFYRDITSSSYYGTSYGSILSQKAQYAKNKEQLDLLAEDDKHLYLFNANDTNTIYSAFSVYEVIPKSYYHNIHRTNMDRIPVHKAVLNDFGIDNPFKEIVNNEIFYYVSYKNRQDASVFWSYILKNYNEEAHMVAAKLTEQGIVYRFSDDNLVVDDTVVRDNETINYNLKTSYNIDENNVSVYGYIYENETDSFAQNVYIKIVNNTNNEASYYLTEQRENKYLASEDKYEGKYSWFSGEITMDDNSDISNYSVFVILTNSNGVYEIQVE